MFRLFDTIRRGEVYFIAEMSANHAGRIENALAIVKEAARAGADCVKLQTYTPDSMTMDSDKEYFHIHGGLWDGYKYYDLYKKAQTPYEWHDAIKRECEACGIDFLSTPFDNSAVDFLEELGAEAYKIASFELVDIPLIEYAASKGKPMILSAGMGSIDEIQDAVDACRRMGNEQIVLLKCCSQYPAPWPEMYLGNIPDMKKRFGVEVGLSDHSIGSLGAVVGVSLGACIIEKHIKLAGTESADSAFSMDIQEYADMIREVRDAKLMAKGPDYTRSLSDRESMRYRRSLFAAEDIEEGEKFTFQNIRSIRPGYGAKPKYLKEIVGKICPCKIEKGEPVTEKFLREKHLLP